jgi:flagellar basal body-associated protein FliL
MSKTFKIALIIILVLVVLAIAGLAVYFLLVNRNQSEVPIQNITNFVECKAAGYPIRESCPQRCQLPDGRTFTQTGVACTLD